MDAVLVGDILRRQAELEQRRIHFEYTWDEIGEYILPRREKYRTSKSVKGERYGRNIYDSTAVQAAQIACDGTQGHMVSSSFRWLALMMRDFEDDHDVRDWLQEATDELYQALNNSNFYEMMNEFIMDGWTIGTATMYIEEDPVKMRPTFRTIHPREAYIAENHYGAIDTVHRKFFLTARQALQAFGPYDERVVLMAQKQPHEEIEFLHAVFPRSDRDPAATDALNMPFASYYIDKGRGLLVRQGGYEQLPYAVWRFRKNSDEEYGRAPGWDALRTTKVLNEMVKSAITMAQKAAQPVRFIPEEYKDVWKFIPGANNYYRDPNRGPLPYQENQQFPVVFEFIRELREQIKQHFWVDFWQMMNMSQQRQKTATEVIEMQNEKLAIFTSSIGRFTNEALNPIVGALFAIENNAGRLPPPPAQLMQGGKIDVDYVGPLNLAIRRLATQGTQQALREIAGYAQLDPNVLVQFDIPGAAKDIAMSFGMDQDRIRTDEEIAEILQAQQEAMAQQQQAQQQQQMASKIDPMKPASQGSMLAQIMGQA
jgi:hypothetical protein